MGRAAEVVEVLVLVEVAVERRKRGGVVNAGASGRSDPDPVDGLPVVDVDSLPFPLPAAETAAAATCCLSSNHAKIPSNVLGIFNPFPPPTLTNDDGPASTTSASVSVVSVVGSSAIGGGAV